jgi:hypothetical protein
MAFLIIRARMHRPHSPWPLRTIKVLGNGACFLAALVGTAWLVERWLPFPEVTDITPKLRYYEEHIGEFDTIFVGSSRSRHQIIPELFEQETAALGVPVRSMNLSCSGLWPPENFYFLRQVLALRPKNLKRIFFEIIDGETDYDASQINTSRVVYWHDWAHTHMAWRMVDEAGPRHAWERFQLKVLHTRIFARQALLLGRGAELAEKNVLPKRKRKPPSWLASRGFDPEPEPGRLVGQELTTYLEHVELSKQPYPNYELRPGLRDALLAIQDEVHAAGIEIVFVVPPTVSVLDQIRKLPDNLPGLYLNNIHTEPELYTPEVHYDEGHLNARGAVIFTRLLARRFVESQQAQGSSR